MGLFVKRFGDHPHRLLGVLRAVVCVLPDPVPVPVDFDVRALLLQLLDLFEAVAVDDSGVMVLGPVDLGDGASDASGGRILVGNSPTVDRVPGVLLVGEDVPDGLHRPLSFACRAGDAQAFQLPLDLHDAPALPV